MSEIRFRLVAVTFLAFLLSRGVLSPSIADATQGHAGGENDPFAGVSSEASAHFYTGAASVTVPILIPPGRASTTPDLGLVYSSHAGLSAAGLGWSLSTGVVMRSTRHGVPRCDGRWSRDFQVSLPGSVNDLVESAPGMFQLRIDEGYAEAFPDETANRWVVRSRDGLRYTFGEAAEARVHTGADEFLDPSSCEFTTAWHLTRIEDPNGNHVEIAYEKRGNTPLPISVEYGGNDEAGITNPFRVRFELEDLPADKPRMRSFRSGVDQRLERRIRRVVVEGATGASGAFLEIRRYDLTYDDSPSTHAFLLSSVGATGLPVRTFHYSTSVPTIVEETSGIVPTSSSHLTEQFPTGPVISNRDMNGDGLLDRVRVVGTDYRVHYGERGGDHQFSAVEYDWSIPQDSQVPLTDRLGAEDSGEDIYLVTDLTGDGKPDFVFRDVAAGTIRVYRGECGESSTDCGFSDQFESWTNPGNRTIDKVHEYVASVAGGRRAYRDMLDMNGDGLPDLVRGAPGGLEVHLNLGNDFEAAPVFLPTGEDFLTYVSNGATYSMAAEVQMIDINGDGLPDRVRGPGFHDWTVPDPRPSFGTRDLRYRAPLDYFAIDQEGGSHGPYELDGGPYLCSLDPGSSTAAVSLCRSGGVVDLPAGWAIVPAMTVELNTGRGFSDRIYSPSPFMANALSSATRLRSSVVYTSVQSVFSHRDFIDMNGDGLVDWVSTGAPPGDGSTRWYVLYNHGDGRFGFGDLDWIRGARDTYPDGPGTNFGEARPRSIIGAGWHFLSQMFFHTSSTPDGLTQHLAQVFDLDSDGIPEMVTSIDAPASRWKLRRMMYRDSSGAHMKPHLLVRVDDGTGGRTHFRYRPSSDFVESGEADNGLPLSLWVVTGIRRTDGLCDDPAPDWFSLVGNPCLAAGHELVQSIAYRGGRFDSEFREFRGFGMVTIFDGPVERGTQRKLQFFQDRFRKGKLASEEVLLGGEDLFSRTTYDWRALADGDRTQIYLQEQRVEEFVLYSDGASAVYEDQCVVHRNSIRSSDGEIDPFGRIVTSCSMGCEGALSSDDLCSPSPTGKKQVLTTYAEPRSGVSSPVWDRPASIMTLFTDSTGVAEVAGFTSYSYDQLEEGVDRGNLSRERNLASQWPFAWVDKLISHDNDSGPGVGNIVSILVPVTGEEREPDTTLYDDRYKLYPVSESAPSTVNRNGEAVHHTIRTQYDLRYGKVSARIGRQGEHNGDLSGAVYDSLGRPLCESGPGADCDGVGEFSASSEYEYGYGDPLASEPIDRLSWVEVRKREPNSRNGYLVSRTYRDALGRERLSVHERYVVASGESTGFPSMERIVARHFDYAPNGRPARQWEPYLAAGGRLSVAAPSNLSAVEFDYSLNGNLRGSGSQGFWDPLGRAWQTVAHDGSTTRRFFFGRTRRSVDGEANHVVEELDAHGRVLRKGIFEGASTLLTLSEREYDGRDRVVREWFGGNASTEIVNRYDMLGRLVEKNDPDSGVWTARFDEAGNKVFLDDPLEGQSLQTCYDDLDRVVMQCGRSSDVYDPGLCGASEPNCTVRYDYYHDETIVVGGGVNLAVGQLTSVEGPDSSHRYVYDVRGRVTRQVDEVLGVAATTEYEYAPDLDRLERMIYPDGESVRYGYDASGQGSALWQESDSERSLVTYVRSAVYDLRGRPLRVERGNGTTEKFAYHGASEGFRPSRVVVDSLFARVGSGSSDSSTAYVDVRFDDYDANGRLKRVLDERAVDGPLSMSAEYRYDGAGRLLAVLGTHWESFGYDSIGNMTWKASPSGVGSFWRTPGADSTFGPHQHDRFVHSGGAHWSMSFDANGRRIAKVRTDGTSRQAYDFDVFGRLRTLSVDGVTKTLGYDHSGQRVFESRAGKTRRFFGRHAESEDGIVHKFYTMGDRLVATRSERAPALSGAEAVAASVFVPPELYWAGMSSILLLLSKPIGRTRRALGLRVSQGSAMGSSLLVATVMLPMALGVGCVGSAEVRHYHTSHRGSPIAITTGIGELERQYRYSAYGEVRRYDGEGNPISIDGTSRREFTGYVTDPESELQYAGARFYDPSQAQFLSMDPKEVDPSPYSYVGWDPVNFVDPNGESGLEALFLGLLGLAAALAAIQGIVVAIQTSSVANGFKTAGLSFAAGSVGVVGGFLAPQALALVPFVTQGLAQASVAAVGLGYSVYGAATASSTEGAVFAGIGVVLSLAMTAYGLHSGSSGQGTSSRPGEPVAGLDASVSVEPTSGVEFASSGGNRMSLIQQMLSILRGRAEGNSIRRAQLQNQAEILRLRAEAAIDGSVRGRPVLDQNVSAFEVFDFTLDSLGNRSFNGSIVAVEFSPRGAPIPSHPSLIGAAGSHLMTVTTGPHPIACGGCEVVTIH